MLLKEKVERKIWLVVGLFFLIGLSHALGSRCIQCMVYDDYANVYQYQVKYLSLYGFDKFQDRVSGVTGEFIFYILMWITSKTLNQDYWLAGLSFYSLLFLYIGFTKYLNPKETLVVIALSSIGLSTQLIRQYIGWSFLFMVLCRIEKSSLKNLLFFISFWIHHSSLILFLKYKLSKVKTKHIILVLIFLFIFMGVILENILSIDYYSIEYLVNESPDSDIFDYNRSFLWRVLLLTPFIFMFKNEFRNYIILCISMYFLFINLPLVPVRFNLLALSHGLSLLIIFVLRKLRYFQGAIYTLLFVFILFKLYFIQNSESPLWTTYGILI
jgi:hypothetical protein